MVMDRRLDHVGLWVWLGAMMAAGDRPAPKPRPSASRRQCYDPVAAARFRIERKFRKSSAFRKINGLPPVSEAEVLRWVDEENAKLANLTEEVRRG